MIPWRIMRPSASIMREYYTISCSQIKLCCAFNVGPRPLFRPPVRSNGRSYKMLVMFLFFPMRNLRDPSADHSETLPHDWKPVLFYKPISKIRGSPPKTFGGQKQKTKTCKISVHFTQLPTLIVNVSGTAQEIQNRKTNWSRAIPPAFEQKGPVNFGPLITEI